MRAPRSSGRANFSMQFDHYELVPQNIGDEIQKQCALRKTQLAHAW
jgi:translation elongation factor EF-G